MWRAWRRSAGAGGAPPGPGGAPLSDREESCNQVWDHDGKDLLSVKLTGWDDEMRDAGARGCGGSLGCPGAGSSQAEAGQGSPGRPQAGARADKESELL